MITKFFVMMAGKRFYICPPRNTKFGELKTHFSAKRTDGIYTNCFSELQAEAAARRLQYRLDLPPRAVVYYEMVRSNIPASFA